MNRRLMRLVILTGSLLLMSMTLVIRVHAAGSSQENAPVSLAEYWALVEETRDSLRVLQASSLEASKPALDALVERWKAVKQVRLGDGSLVPVDSSYLVMLLAKGENQRSLQIIETLLSAHQRYPSRVFTTHDLESLAAILARPEFQWREQAPNPIVEWVQKMLNRIFAWLDKLLGRQSERTPGTVGIQANSVISTIILGLLLLVIGYVLWSLFRDLAIESRLHLESDAADEVLTSEAAFTRAQSLSRGGDYRSAVRYLYLSSLLLLDERGLLRYDRSKTNREYLRSVSGAPELSEPLQEVIDVFDNVWYGYHALDEKAFDHYSQRVEELKEKKAP